MVCRRKYSQVFVYYSFSISHVPLTYMFTNIFVAYSNISNITASTFNEIYTLQFGIPPLTESAKSFASGEVLVSAIEAKQATDSATLASYIAQHEFSTVYGEVRLFYDDKT